MPTLKEILEDLANAQRGNMNNPGDYIELCSLSEAHSAIIELIKGKAKGKEKEFYLIAENPKYTREHLREIKPYCEGYNQALIDILKELDKL